MTEAASPMPKMVLRVFPFLQRTHHSLCITRVVIENGDDKRDRTSARHDPIQPEIELNDASDQSNIRAALIEKTIQCYASWWRWRLPAPDKNPVLPNS